MTARRHAAPAPPAPGTRSRSMPTTRGHIARLLGAGTPAFPPWVVVGGVVAACLLIDLFSN